MKITLVGVREWETKDAKTGEEISGLSYIGFLAGGQPIQFSSKETYPVHTGFVGFDTTKAINIELLTSLFDGKVKYKDAASYGQE